MTPRLLLLTLTILSFSMPVWAAAPANDAMNRAVVARSLPFFDALDTTDATTALRDPQCAGQGPTVWFVYRPTSDRWMEANTFGSDYDTTLSVYTRQGQTLQQLACNDDAVGLQSQIRFHAQRGVTYYFMVGAWASGAGGPLTFAMDVSPNQADTGLDLRITSAVLNADTGLVTLQGTVRCSRPLSGYVSGQILQKRGQAEVGAFFGAEVLCTGSGRWTAVSSRPRPIRGSGPRAAVFSRGRAFATGRVWAWDEYSGEVSEGEATSTLRIQ